MKADLLLQSLSLLSQKMPKLPSPYGELFKSTSCVNAEEREIIGVLHALKELIKDEKELAELTGFIGNKIIPFVEIIGISRWPRTELTDLGLRVGETYKKKIFMPKMPNQPEEGAEPWANIGESEIIDSSNPTQ